VREDLGRRRHANPPNYALRIVTPAAKARFNVWMGGLEICVRCLFVARIVTHSMATVQSLESANVIWAIQEKDAGSV